LRRGICARRVISGGGFGGRRRISRLARSADSARLGRGGGRSGHWSCAHWLRAMAGIDAGEGAAAAPPPELSPQQRIEQVRRVLLAGQSVYP